MNGGRIPRNVTAICETFKISCMLGRHPMRGALENLFKGPIIPFRSLVEYYPISAKDQSGLHIGASLARYIPRLCIVCGENLKGRHYGRRH